MWRSVSARAQATAVLPERGASPAVRSAATRAARDPRVRPARLHRLSAAIRIDAAVRDDGAGTGRVHDRRRKPPAHRRRAHAGACGARLRIQPSRGGGCDARGRRRIAPQLSSRPCAIVQGGDPDADAPVRMLEKTPKNALRVPFLARVFPEARFIYLHRDPRPVLASMMEAWQSGRFRTYPNLPGWTGLPWSLLLVPGWRDLLGRPLHEDRRGAVEHHDRAAARRPRAVAARFLDRGELRGARGRSGGRNPALVRSQ